MRRPKQSVHIIWGGTYYTFDAVVKADHQHQLDIAEKHEDVKDKEHVNYAQLKPSMLVLEVSVSDAVVVGGEPLTSGGGARSANAYQTLLRMQRSREYLQVVTRMHTLNSMMIETLAVSESLEFQNEMHATVSFKEMIVTPPAPKKVASKNPPKDKPDEGAKLGTTILFDMLNRDKKTTQVLSSM